jgi:hypothetical protein
MRVVSCFEAGRDGFWLHRLLSAHGVINHVVEPTSILVIRCARRAKTDRLDAVGLLRVLAAKFAGDPGACRTVVVPSVEEEDAEAAASGAGIPGAGARAQRKSHRRAARPPGRSGEAVSPFLGRRHEGAWNGRRPPAADPSRRRVEPLAPAAVADDPNPQQSASRSVARPS